MFSLKSLYPGGVRTRVFYPRDGRGVFILSTAAGPAEWFGTYKP
jgi:hypothetical protein